MIHMYSSYNAYSKNTSEDNMASQGLWSRWHRFDQNGVKYIRKFQIGETPNPLIEEGYTTWHRGTGPLSPSHYEKVANALRKVSKGKPKSDKTKYLMRLAKLGIPKSTEHKKNMSLAQRRRFAREKNESNSVKENSQCLSIQE